MDNLILITGAARSGISLIAGVVRLCGAWGGQTVQPTRTDKHVSLENIEIRDSVVKSFLRGIKADPNGQYPLPDLKACHNLANKVAPWWRQRIEKIVKDQGYSDGQFFFANAQSCLIWPIWAKAFPGARWIIVRRKDDDIVRSCLNTGFMARYKRKDEWQQWLDVHKLRFAEMIAERLNVWQIWPQRMVLGKLAELHELIDVLDLKWDNTTVKDFIAPILWKAGIFEVSK